MKKTIILICVFALISVLVIFASVYQPVVNFPANESKVNTHYVLLNFTANGSILVFANDNSSRLNTKNGLVYINSSQLNKTMTYNLTTLPIQSDSDGLVALYHFDNRSEFGENNSLVYDFSGNANNGTCTNCPTWNETGKIAGAYVFDGVDDFINTGDMSNINFSKNFTTSFWFMKNHAKSMEFIGYNKDGSNKMWDFIINTGGTLAYNMQNASGSQSTHTSTASLTETDLWYNVIFTIDNSNSELNIFVNGEVFYKDVAINTEGLVTKIGSPTMFLGSFRGSFNFLNGSMDEIAIWNRTLTTTEISRVYRLGEKKFFWKVNATDVSGNSNESGTFEFDVDINANITVNFSQNIGDIRSNFYGVTQHGIWGSNTSWINLDADGTLDTVSNYTWHRDAYTNAGINYLRADMALLGTANEDGTFKTTSTDNYGNINTRANLVKWAFENNIKVLFIASFMPTWLNDTSNGCISDPDRCPPTNYTRWGELIVDWINITTNDGEYASAIEIEVWNEPDVAFFWLPDYALTNINRSIFYNKLYNATYNATKTAYPTIPVGGPSTSEQDAGTELIMFHWMNNFTDKIDFVSHHEYKSLIEGDFDTLLENQYEWIFNNISSRGVNTDRIIISEFNVQDSDTKLNNPTEHKLQIALAYSGTLNSYPTNITMAMYQWAETLNYTEGGITNYPEFPQRWTMVAEPKLENEFYISYNVTKNFATFHSTGSTVVNSTSDNGDVRVVTSNQSEFGYLTVINTDSEEVNITINSGTTDYISILNLQNNVIQNYSDSINLGDIEGFGVEHYRLGECEYFDNNTNLTYTSNLCNETNNQFTFTLESSMIKINNLNDTVSYDINFYNLGTFNQVFTLASSSSENANDFTETIPASGRSFVFSYLTASQPTFSSIALTVTDMNQSYNPNSRVFTLGCEGTGGITVQGLNIVKGTGRFYEVKRDGASQGTFNTDSFTTSGCSVWEFSPSGVQIVGQTARFLRVALMVIIATAILVSILVPVIASGGLSLAFIITILLISIIGLIAISFINSLI